MQLGLGAAVNAPLAAALMGKPAGVAIASCIAMNLPADGAGAASQSPGDGSDALLLLQPQCNRVALGFFDLLVGSFAHGGLYSEGGVALQI